MTDSEVIDRLEHSIRCTPLHARDRLQVLGATRLCADRFSFTQTRTYPRPDHPDPQKRKSIFFLLAAIIVSLRTTLENEQIAMAALMERVQSDEHLLNLPVSELESLIRPAGMARQKAERITASLHALAAYPGGIESLASLPMVQARAYLLSLPGIGPKAADCLLTIGLGIPSMVVDVNVHKTATWILLGSEKSVDYKDAKDVSLMKSRLDRALAGEDAFLYQIVHTHLLLLGKSMGRQGHATARCGP